MQKLKFCQTWLIVKRLWHYE